MKPPWPPRQERRRAVEDARAALERAEGPEREETEALLSVLRRIREENNFRVRVQEALGRRA